MKKVTIFIRILMIINIFLEISSGNADVNSPLAPALYVFGDSLLDSGNNNLLLTAAKANYWPYGMNFEKGATGRFTNGKTVADFLAEFLGLPFPPPYVSLLRGSDGLTGLNLGSCGNLWDIGNQLGKCVIEQINSLNIIVELGSKGVNYASASCGILPETGNDLGKCLNLVDQIDLFQRTVEMELPMYFKTSQELSNYLSKSIFLITMGSNDYLNHYGDQRQTDSSNGIDPRPIVNFLVDTISLRDDPSKSYSPQSFAKLLVDKVSMQLQRLYKLGARKVVMFELGPLGCTPSITRKYKHNGACVEELNQLAIIFNNQLGTMIQNLGSTLKGSAFVLGHAHWLGYDAVINPSNYGLTDSSNPCCTAWTNGTSACIPEIGACTDPDKHYFWDGYHLTESVYRILSTTCFNGTSVCIPTNIKKLAQL